MIYEGMKIKIFPDTDVDAYVRWIRSQGFKCFVHEEDIRVGSRIREANLNPRLTGEVIKVHMKQNKIRKNDLTRILNVSDTAVFDWMYGRRVPSQYYRQDLLELLKITPEEWERCRA